MVTTSKSNLSTNADGYFSVLPIVNYNDVLTRNIATSVKLVDLLASDGQAASLNYYNYTLRDGERPDTIAFDYYGSSSYTWLVLLSNYIIDISDGWLLSRNDFDDFITAAYGSNSAAIATIHHYVSKPVDFYYRLSNPDDVINSSDYNNNQPDKSAWEKLPPDPDDIQEISPEDYLIRTDKVNFDPVTAMDYEFDKNETKRTIRLLNKDYIQVITSNFQELMTT